jgi:hypothetical protein
MSGVTLFLGIKMPEIRIGGTYTASLSVILGLMLFPRDPSKASIVGNEARLNMILTQAVESQNDADMLSALVDSLHNSLKFSAIENSRAGCVAGDVLTLAYEHYLKTGKCSVNAVMETYWRWASKHRYGDGEVIDRSRTKVLDSMELVKPAIHLWAAYRYMDGSPELRKTQFSSEGLKNLIGLARTFESFVLDDGWRKLRSGQSYVKYSEIYKFVNCPIDEIKPVFKVV